MDANGISNICRNDSAITVISTANNENIPYSVNDKSEGLLIQSATSVYDHKSSTDSTSNKQPPPLKGVRVCCTGYGVQQRTSIYTVVSRLGGSCVRDLTDDTTHLIAGTTDSEKHKVAISRNIPVVKPAWLFTCKKLYMKGLPVDIPALTKEFTVKLLSYKHICLTGLDIDERQRLQDLIMQHGGCYAADLVPNCTHLIASIGQGIKYQYAIKWKINIVNVDWLYESIKQQVCLPEADYPVTVVESTPEAEAITAEEDQSRVIRQGTETPRAIAASRRSSMTVTTPTKSRHSTVAMEEKTNLLKDTCMMLGKAYAEQASQELKQLVVQHGGRVTSTFEVGITHYLLPSLESLTVEDRNRLLDCSWHPKPVIVKDEWIRMCSQLNKLLPMQSYEIILPASMSPTGMTTRKRPLARPMLRSKTAIVKRSGPSSFGIHDFYQNIIEDHGVAGQLDISMLAVKQMSVLSTQAPHRFNQNVPLTSTPSVSPMTKTKDGVFDDCGFLIMGFNETRKSTLKTAIEEVGGHVEMAPSSWLQWTPPQPDRRWYILVPFVSDPSQIPTGTFKIITEYWIERCLTDEKLCPTQACIMYQPCSIKLPLPTLRDFVISTTGIEDALLSDQIKRLIGDIGARYDGCFTSRHPLLICGKPSGKKYEHALKWKTPVTTVHWLYDVIRTGKIPNPAKFPITSQSISPTSHRSFSATQIYPVTSSLSASKLATTVKRSASIPIISTTPVVKPTFVSIKRRRCPSPSTAITELSQQLSPFVTTSSTVVSDTSSTTTHHHHDRQKKTPSPKLTTATTTTTTTTNVRLKSAPLSANDILKDLMESMQGYTNKSQPCSFPYTSEAMAPTQSSLAMPPPISTSSSTATPSNVSLGPVTYEEAPETKAAFDLILKGLQANDTSVPNESP